MPGLVEFNDGRVTQTMTCESLDFDLRFGIEDESDDAARLAFYEPIPIPDTIDLVDYHGKRVSREGYFFPLLTSETSYTLIVNDKEFLQFGARPK